MLGWRGRGAFPNNCTVYLSLQLGFEVLEAENGNQCVDVYSKAHRDIVCVFLVRVPGTQAYSTNADTEVLSVSTPWRRAFIPCN